MAYKTKFLPKNKEKYVGDVNSIVCRSLWERSVCKFFDENSNILKWASEEITIPYINPFDNKVHTYYPDFLVQFKTPEGNKSWLIEIKPKKQVVLKENSSKKEKITWAINNAKWKAAENYCLKHNFEFKVLTEKEIFANG
jgi:hypothetical protein